MAKDGEAHENEKKSSVNYLISDWLFDDARKAGDTTVITNAIATMPWHLRRDIWMRLLPQMYV